MPQPPETPALRALRIRLGATLQHLETVDAALALTEQTAKTGDPRQPLLKALAVQGKYETLQVPAQQARAFTNFARGENLELALLAVAAHFLSYLRAVVPPVHRSRPLVSLLAGAGAGEIEWDRLLQRFEGRGGIAELIGAVLEDTGIELDPDIGRQAHAYLAMRDLYLYNGGLVDEEFARLHGETWNVQPGHKLPKHLKLGRTAIRAVERLAVSLDAALRPLLGE